MNRDTKSHEGFRGNVYKDSKGYDTIGYGHKLTDAEKKAGTYSKGLTEEQASNLYASDRAAHDKKFYAANPQFQDAPANVKAALEDMAYNMGPSFLKKFPKASAHLAAGNYAQAGDEFMDSKYADEVGQRAVDNASLLRDTPAYPEPDIASQPGLTPNPTVVPSNIQQQFAGLGNVTPPAPVAVPVAPEALALSGLGGFSGFGG